MHMKIDEMPKEARYKGASISASSTGLGPATRGSTTSSRTRSSMSRHPKGLFRRVQACSSRGSPEEPWPPWSRRRCECVKIFCCDIFRFFFFVICLDFCCDMSVLFCHFAGSISDNLRCARILFLCGGEHDPQRISRIGKNETCSGAERNKWKNTT